MIVPFFLFLWTGLIHAHTLTLNTQHIDLKKQKESAWQHDVLGRAVITRDLDLGLQATYLERFGYFEKRAGAFVMYHPTSKLTLEARYLKGENDNIILPKNEYNLTAYYALAQGYTPYLIYRNVNYSATQVNSGHLGLEIEKIRNIIIIPHLMLGKATFDQPAETSDVYSYGLRVMYYQEKNFSVFAFGAKGQEASQGIIGVTNILVNTLTGGIGAGYFLTSNVRAELTLDHTDYKEIGTQFFTTNLNLQWMF